MPTTTRRGRPPLIPGMTQAERRRQARREALERRGKRPCDCCGAPLTPKKDDQRFCSDACRKELHRYGGVSPRKLFPLIARELLAPLERRLAALEAEVARCRPQQ